ncbi:MAG: hypothetical protein N3B10_15540, partial [Armatimonadetes bacterium]|nr:hypothetical protein [Armatimonadota bacterium]
MRRRLIGLIAIVFAVLGVIWFRQTLSSSEVVEVRAKVLPIGFVSSPIVHDLNGDENDELLLEVSRSSWLGRTSDRVFVVTMRDGQLVAHPTPFSFARVSSTGGKRLIGIVESGKRREVAVAEWLPKGEWKVEKLGAEEEFDNWAVGDWDGDG